jgi:hypothetical protein
MISEAHPKREHFHPVLRYTAGFISYLFHPLFIPVYILAFLVYHTLYFPAYTPQGKVIMLARFFLMYSIFPLVTVLLAKGLGFIQSVHLRTQKDRIIPYVACGIYYFWMWYVLHNQEEVPAPLVKLSLAIFLASSLGLVANSFFKISMHALSMGVMFTFMLLISFSTFMNFGPYLSVATFIAGLVCTARLIHSDHTNFEIYSGLMVGCVAQLIAFWIG